MSLVQAAANRSRAVLMVLFLIVVVGAVSYWTIPKESSPDVKIPVIYVNVTLEGITPEDAERLLVRPLEQELRGIEGIKEIISFASQGRASVQMEFDAGFDSEQALADVREKVDIARPELPEEADEPIVQEVNFSLFPVLNVILKGNIPERALVTIARDLRDKIEEISMVLSVNIAGDREEAVNLIIEPEILNTYNLTVEDVARVDRFNKLVPAGNIDTEDGRFPIKVPGLLETAREIAELPVKTNGEAVVLLRDVLTVQNSFKDPESYARVNFEPSVALEVSKRTGENIIETVDAVRALVAEEQQYWPEGLEVVFAQDESGRIMERLNDLNNNILFAMLLVLVVVLVVVGPRSALFVATAIPGSFLIGILALTMLDLTMNIVVLFSLILSVGMVVDNAIVVAELANRKIMTGMRAKEAYIHAAERMAWPLIASTVTTLIVFAPLLFWPGIVGQFMLYLPLTLIMTLTGSLMMALIFIPVLGGLWGRGSDADPGTLEYLEKVESGHLDELKGLAAWYIRNLRAVLKRPGWFALAIVGVMVAGIVLYSTFGKGVEFFPEIEPDDAQVQIRARGNLSVAQQDALTKEIEERIADMGDEIRVFYARSGDMGQQGNENIPEDAIGVIQVEFQPWYERRKAAEILEEIRERTKDIAGIVIETREREAGPPVGKPIQLMFSSRFPEKLDDVVEKVRAAMQEIGGFVDVQDTRTPTSIEWELEVNRELAARYGVDIPQLGSAVRLVTNGLVATTYRPDTADDEVDVQIRFPEDSRTLAALERLRVTTDQGPVPMINFVEQVPKQQVGNIERRDGRRVLFIRAEVEEGILPNEKVQALRDWFEKHRDDLDPAVTVAFRGEDEEQQETGQFLSKAFLLALMMMALVLVLQFNNFYHAFIIMSAVFLSTTGVLLGLIVTNQPFGIVMCGIAVIALAGIVVNNNIIFIDTFAHHRRNGVASLDAILRTGAERMRPILLTAGTTVLGLTPMVTTVTIDFFARDVSVGAPSTQWWEQLSTSIAGGLSFATILTLFFTPCLLLLGEKRKQRHTDETQQASQPEPVAQS